MQSAAADDTTAGISAAASRLAAELNRAGAGSALAALAAARELAAAAARAQQVCVDRARAAGHSWKEIGDVLETTRQAAFQRFGRPVDPRSGRPMTAATLPDAADRALAVFGELAAGRWEAARAVFGERMLEQVSAVRLAGGWADIAGLVGRFERAGEPMVHALGERTIADVPLHFEAGDATGRVTFDPDGTIAGLFIRPAVQ